MSRERLRLAIIGAGPIGLESAVRGVVDGHDVTVFERGDIGRNVGAWGHVTLFSPFGMNRSRRAVAFLAEANPTAAAELPEDEACVTGRVYRDRYLVPLAESLQSKCRVLARTRAHAISREGLLKGSLVGHSGRGECPLRLLVSDEHGVERVDYADVVIDATGTYGRHNALGSGGIFAPGERAATGVISYMLDDILGAHRSRYAGKHTLLVGAGYSAATNAVALGELQRENSGTKLTWVTLQDRAVPIPNIPNDPLPVRRSLTDRANALAVDENRCEFIPGASVERIEVAEDGATAVTIRKPAKQDRVIHCDRILANVGYRPDQELYRELQIHECYATSGPMKLSASLLSTGAASADCLDQTAPGSETLRNPEPDFFILGSKSYGRNSRFLIKVGLEQIDQLFDELIHPSSANVGKRSTESDSRE
jgi:thioredoxin reductase